MSETQQHSGWIWAALIGLFVAAINGMALIPKFGVKTEFLFWLPAYAAAVTWIVLRPGQFLAMLEGNLIFLFWALLAMVSAFWSLTPDISRYQGFQLLMTVLVSWLIVTRFKIEDVAVAVFWAILIAQLFSILRVYIDPVGAYNEHGDFVGVFPHKNILAAYSSLQLVTAACLLGSMWRPVLCSAVTVMSLVFVLLSGSATSLMACVILIPFLVMAWLCGFQRSVFPISAGLAVVFLAVFLPAIVLLDIDLIGNVLQSVGRSKTLTGRTTIWDFGMAAFWDRPWFGHGYKGYWQSYETTSFTLQLTIQQRIQSFHNTFIEVGVAFGIIGLVALVWGLCVAQVRAYRMWSPALGTIRFWPMAVMILILVLTMSEVPLFNTHGLFQMLLVICAAAGLATQTNPDRRVDTRGHQ